VMPVEVSLETAGAGVAPVWPRNSIPSGSRSTITVFVVLPRKLFCTSIA